MLKPFLQRHIFASEEQAIRSLLRDHVLLQIDTLRAEDRRLAQKYGMHFERFEQYLHERSALLAAGPLSLDEQRALGQAVMLEEDDWMEWKAAREMLESWLATSLRLCGRCVTRGSQS